MTELQVWQYWEGPMPAYIELCMDTVRRHHPTVDLLDRDAFDALWETDRDVPLEHLGPAHRADFVRAYLLHHHGGVWLDSDFVLLRPLDELERLPDAITFAGYRTNGRTFTNNLMFSRLGDPVLAECYARICDHLRAGRRIDWLEIGAFALAPAIQAHPGAVHELEEALVCPIPWHQMARFEQPGDAGDLAAKWRWGVMLSNNSATDALRARTRGEMLSGDTLLGDLLRRALGG